MTVEKRKMRIEIDFPLTCDVIYQLAQEDISRECDKWAGNLKIKHLKFLMNVLKSSRLPQKTSEVTKVSACILLAILAPIRHPKSPVSCLIKDLDLYKEDFQDQTKTFTSVNNNKIHYCLLTGSFPFMVYVVFFMPKTGFRSSWFTPSFRETFVWKGIKVSEQRSTHRLIQRTSRQVNS